IVQTRNYELKPRGRRGADKFATIDSPFARMFALFLNAAILSVSAATVYRSGHSEVVAIGGAYQLLTPPLGVCGAHTLFTMATPVDHPLDCHHSGRDCDGCFGRKRHGKTAGAEPGNPEPAAQLRRIPTRHVHERQT